MTLDRHVMARLCVSLLAFAGIGWLVLVMLVRSATFGGPGSAAQGAGYSDFDEFHLVGRMIWQGAAAQAYALPDMLAALHVDAGLPVRMPWAYPPQFDLVVAALALVSKGTAYLVFIGGAFIFYLWVLRRLAGPEFAVSLLICLPALNTCMTFGQNGFLTAGLAGAFALWMLRNSALAGLPLGLMVIKPHLAIGLAAVALARRQWGVLGLAALVVLATSAAASLAFGLPIWADFAAAVQASSSYLRKIDGFPLYRMVSIYATARTQGLSAETALLLQGGVGLAAIAVVVVAAVRRVPPRHLLGAAMLCTVAVSPYSYDYDLPMLGMAAGLLAADLRRAATWMEQIAIFALAWIAGGWLQVVLATKPPGRVIAEETTTLAGAAYLALVVLILAVLRRARSQGPLCASPVAPASAPPRGVALEAQTR